MREREWVEDGMSALFDNAGCEPPQPKFQNNIKDLKSASADQVFDGAFYINATSTFDESSRRNRRNRWVPIQIGRAGACANHPFGTVG